MRKSFNLFLVSIALTFILQSCKTANPVIVKDEIQVVKIEDVLSGNDINLINLLNKVRGSVGKRGPASKTIWTRKNDFGLGLYISANHVYNLSGWQSRQGKFFDLFNENPGIFETSKIPPANGSVNIGNTLIADFPLMHFKISANATNTTILPEEDFYLGIIDNQRVEQTPFARYPTKVQKETPLEMYDPDNRTKAIKTWSNPISGQKAIAIGYPQDNVKYPNGAVAYGKILSDAEALAVIQKLKDAGDSEGEIPYNATAAFFVEAKGLAGMSGGGVFNLDGQLLGIMVRASDKVNAPKILRVVKVSFIKLKMTEYFNSLSDADKAKLRPFISGEL